MGAANDFWDDSDYFTGPPIDADMVGSAEQLFGYKLPTSYVRLLETRNGGSPLRSCFPTTAPTSWAKDHIALSGIRGIGGEWGIDSPELGTIPMAREWGYPSIGIIVGECPSAGHDVVMLDYSLCGPTGEPRVVHVDMQCHSPRVTVLADTFQAFLDGLVDCDRYEDEV